MPIKTLDHVNLRTSRLDEMIEWYGRVLNLHPGKRPEFNFPGAWLYIGDLAAIHLIGVPSEPRAEDPKLEHFAMGAEGMKEFVENLKENNVSHSVDNVPGFPVVQVNFRDPDGNHIHVDFAAEEAEALG